MKENNIEELKRLLYRNELSQYGKRKLIDYYEQQEKNYKRALEMNEVLLKENKKKDELIEGMKTFLLKENKMCDFLESEE